jgi:hypothetical protein
MKKHLAKKKCAGSVLHTQDGGRRFLWKPGIHLPDHTVHYPKINFHFVQACTTEMSPLQTKELSSSNPNHTRSRWFLLISLSFESPGKFDNSALKCVTNNDFQIPTDHVWHSLIPEFTPLIQHVTHNITWSVSTLCVATRQIATSSQLWHNLDRTSRKNSKSKSALQMSVSINRNAVLEVQHTFHA